MVIFHSSPVVDFYFIWNRINESPESWWIYSLNLLFFQHGVNFTNKNVVSVCRNSLLKQIMNIQAQERGTISRRTRYREEGKH